MLSTLKRQEYYKKIKNPYIMLGILISVTFIISYIRYLFGGEYFIFKDAGSDCYEEYYPLYVYIVNRIKSGEFSLWNNSWGLGCDTLSRQEWLLDPFAIITIIIGVLGNDHAIAVSLVIAQFLKILLAGFLFYKYLGYFDLEDAVKIIGAYLYAFNSYLIVWGQHYWFGAASVYMVALLIALEAWIHNINKPKKYMLVYSLIVAAFFIYSVYFAYMAIVVTSVYVCIRYLYTQQNKKGIERETFKNGIRIIIAIVLGIVIAGVMVLPFVDNTMGVSTRISTDSIWRKMGEWLAPYSMEYYISTLLRMISSNVMGINSLGGGYYGLPLLSVSIIGIPFLTEGLLDIADKSKEKGKKSIFVISLILIIFLVFIPLGSCILNAFQYPFGRYTFVILPIITVILALGIQRVCYSKKMNYAITGVMVCLEIALLIYAAFAYENSSFIRKYIKVVILMNLALYGIMILGTARKKVVYQLAIFGLLIIGCIGETYVSSSSRERSVLSASDLEYAKRVRTENIIKELEDKDDGYFRIDKTYNDYGFLGDMLIEGLHLPTSYNSTLNGNIARFYEEIWPEVMTNGTCKVTTARDYILNGTSLNKDNILALLGVKYILSDQQLTDLDEQWERIEINDPDIIVYQNMQADSVVTGFDRIISEEQFEEYSDEMRKKIIKSYLIMDQETIRDAGLKISSVEADILNEADYDNNYSLQLVKDTYFKGEMDIDHDKYLLTAIPYRKGWNVYIDGNKVPVYKGDYGFIAFQISEGDHLVEIKYENMIYVIGCLLSVLGIIIWIILYKTNILDRLFMKKEKM